MQKITKAILPVAGFGTRFLPVTKALPKEMLPIVDKPIIQYLVEEAVAAGIKEIIFVTGRGKRSIEDHFDDTFELEHNLVEKHKHELLKEIYKISRLAKFAYVRQPKPLGDGHAISCARHLVGNEPCAILFGDDIIDNKVVCVRQLINVYEKYGDSVVALEKVPESEVSRYGVVSGVEVGPKTYKLDNIVEKPKIEEAPSNLTIVGKYVITKDVFDALETIKPGKDGEIRLADALKAVLMKNKAVYGLEFEGKRYDCGSKIGLLKANVDFALKHENLNGEFREYLKGLEL